MSPLALAFVGDAVLELSSAPPGGHDAAATQSSAPWRRITSAPTRRNLELDIIEPMLTDAEPLYCGAAKTPAKATVAKHATVQEYRASTGFECLLGWLYLQGRNDRIEELFNAMWDGYKPE